MLSAVKLLVPRLDSEEKIGKPDLKSKDIGLTLAEQEIADTSGTAYNVLYINIDDNWRNFHSK